MAACRSRAVAHGIAGMLCGMGAATPTVNVLFARRALRTGRTAARQRSPTQRHGEHTREPEPEILDRRKLLTEVMDVPKVDAQVELDAALLTTVDAVAERLGIARDAVIEDSIRRGLAARVLGDVLTRTRDRSGLSEEDAAELAYNELKMARAARRNAPPDVTPDDSAR